MSQLRLVLAKIFRPYSTLKSITRLSTHVTHHGLKALSNFIVSSHFKMRTFTISPHLLYQQSNLNEGFKKLHIQISNSDSSIHAIQMHNLLEQIQTVASEEESTADTLCFEEMQEMCHVEELQSPKYRKALADSDIHILVISCHFQDLPNKTFGHFA